MKELILNVLYLAAITISLIAAIEEKWQLAIWFALLLILIELDQIHDTIKAAHSIKGEA